MKVWIDIEVEDRTFPIRALIDTGAEVNIIKKGLYPRNTYKQIATLSSYGGPMKENSREVICALGVRESWTVKPLRASSQ